LDDAGVLPRPAIPFVVESARRRIGAFGLVDSGSDLSVISRELALRLGVMPKRASMELRVFGRAIPAGRAELAIELPVRRGVARISPAEFAVPFGVADVAFPILGRSPLFEHFEVRFQEWRKRAGLTGRDRAPARWGPDRNTGRPRLLPIADARRRAGKASR